MRLQTGPDDPLAHGIGVTILEHASGRSDDERVRRVDDGDGNAGISERRMGANECGQHLLHHRGTRLVRREQRVDPSRRIELVLQQGERQEHGAHLALGWREGEVAECVARQHRCNGHAQ